MNLKSATSSVSSLSSVMLPSQANPAGNVHGGEIMKLMDTAASVTAMRHCKRNVVTVRVDELIFHEPIYVGNLVTVISKLTFVGKSSMEIKVEVWVEDMKSEKECHIAQTAYFTFVALDDDNNPVKVPGIFPTTPEELKLFKKGEERYLKYKNEVIYSG
jgi:acyl-CoA hydrolase